MGVSGSGAGDGMMESEGWGEEGGLVRGWE